MHIRRLAMRLVPFNTKLKLCFIACFLSIAFIVRFYAINRSQQSIGHNYVVPFKNMTFPLRFIFEPRHSCRSMSESMKVAILVLSSSKDVAQRDAIRETWLTQITSYPIFVAFVLGFGTWKSIPEQMHDLTEEQEKHGDLIVADFVDTYFNLSIKTYALLAWSHRNCHDMDFLIKADSDVIISLEHLSIFLEMLYDRPKSLQKPQIFGHCNVNAIRERLPTDKNYVPDWAFPGSVYPVYCQGSGYMISWDAISKLLEGAKGMPIFYGGEDSLFTGVIADNVGVRRRCITKFVSLLNYFTLYLSPDDELLLHMNCLFFVLSETYFRPDNMRRGWQGYLRTKSDVNCSVHRQSDFEHWRNQLRGIL